MVERRHLEEPGEPQHKRRKVSNTSLVDSPSQSTQGSTNADVDGASSASLPEFITRAGEETLNTLLTQSLEHIIWRTLAGAHCRRSSAPEDQNGSVLTSGHRLEVDTKPLQGSMFEDLADLIGDANAPCPGDGHNINIMNL